MYQKPSSKLILIDEYKELTALKDVRGPRTGPIRTPYRMPIEKIGAVLNQMNKPTLFEVIVVEESPEVIYSERVRLTPENYILQYNDILAIQNGDITIDEFELDSDESEIEEDKLEPAGEVVLLDSGMVTEESKEETPEVPTTEEIILVDAGVTTDVIEGAEAESVTVSTEETPEVTTTEEIVTEVAESTEETPEVTTTEDTVTEVVAAAEETVTEVAAEVATSVKPRRR